MLKSKTINNSVEDFDDVESLILRKHLKEDRRLPRKAKKFISKMESDVSNIWSSKKKG